MKKYALLVAGGSGNRMNSETPKQFLSLAGKPVLLHCLQLFYLHDRATELILVLPEQEIKTWKALLSEHHAGIPHTIITGGKTRFESVANGLKEINGDGIVAIHDGVRPLISTALIARCMRAALEFGSAIPCIPIHESLRRKINGSSQALDRSGYLLVQTPQCFRLPAIKKAYAREFQPEFTDDATVFEKDGHAVHIVEGERWNIKITYPTDLVLADMILKKDLGKNQV